MLLSGGEGQPRITELWRTAGVCPLFAAERGVGVTRRVWAEGGDGSRSPRIRGLLPLLISRASTMSEPESCCRVSDAYCDRCDLLVGLASLHVIGLKRDEGGGLVATMRSAPALTGCRSAADRARVGERDSSSAQLRGSHRVGRDPPDPGGR